MTDNPNIEKLRQQQNELALEQEDKRVKIALKPLEHAVGLRLPTYATPLSAGMDLSAALEEAIELDSGERALVPTGLAIALPPGYEAQIRPRSGLALKHGVTVLNTPAPSTPIIAARLRSS